MADVFDGQKNKDILWLNSQSSDDCDWNCDAMTALAMSNLAASTLPGFPGVPLTNRFQEHEPEDESECVKCVAILEVRTARL